MKLVLCDMDGTLLNDKKEVPAALFPLMDALKDRGVCFGICSGRQYETLRRVFPNHYKEMLFVAENGAIVFENGRCLWTEQLDNDWIQKAIDVIRPHAGITPILCGEKCAYIESEDGRFLENARMYYKKLRMLDRLEDAFQEDSICKIAVYDAVDSFTNGYPALKGLEGYFQVTVSGKEWVDLMKNGTNKGRAVARIKKMKGLDAHDCVAFGDFLNDYEMMQECYYSYAMANAVPALKEICRFAAPPNNDEGVITALKELYHLA